ncbi:Smg5 nonsense mediated mRNA decay factor [Carabus blaptoides fortunei]
MKKGYNSSDIPQQEGQDQARRLHRSISDNARRLDDARGCAHSISDLFESSLLVQRSRLRENCERLIFLDPILYGRKGEELLWRKVYYDVVSTSKRVKQKEYTVEDIAHLQCHINAGIGYYHHFISRLQLEYDLTLQGVVDFPISTSERSVKHQNSANKIDSHHNWAELSVHRSLIYLGDLSRYKLEICPNWDHGLAIRYYLQASNFKPEYGMPHNQLGTLATGLNNSLDAVYHYMRCLSCTHIFEGTENNLLRLFEKNSYAVEKIPIDASNIKQEPSEHIKHLFARFMLLVDILYFEKKGTHIHSLCHQVLLDFQSCLSYPKPVASESGDSSVDTQSDNDSFSYLNSDTVFKMVIICLMCITKLQKTESQQLSSLKAFLLAIYSQLIQNVIDHIEGSVFNMSLPSPETVLQNGDVKGKRSISKLRRRKLKNDSDDSDLSESEVSFSSSSASELNSDLSENEVIFSSGDESDDENKKHKTPKVNGTDSVIANGKSDSQSDTNEVINEQNEVEDPVKKVKRMDPIDLLEIVAEEGMLQSIKILCDWLIGDIVVLKECGNSSQILLRKIIQLLNLINIDMTGAKLKCIKLKSEALQKDHNQIPLPEDVILKGVPILQTVHDQVNWNYLNSNIIEPKEEALLRVNKLVAFGHFLVDINETGINYDNKQKCFTITEVTPIKPEPLPVENNTLTIEETPTKNNESISRGKLMKDMGQLWLAAEVQDLESRVQGRTAFSPYLVLDVDALIHYTHLAKQFVSARKFIVLVPVIVLSALDELKRETIKAREAIRWLETQFHRGNRFLRAQRPQERSPIPLIKYPKKKDKETYMFIQIIECCHFLTQQQKGATNLVTLLTGNQNALVASETREISCMGLAQSAGVNLELITTFHMKWKKSVKGNRSIPPYLAHGIWVSLTTCLVVVQIEKIAECTPFPCLLVPGAAYRLENPQHEIVKEVTRRSRV